jgi:hypothetical protein
MTRFAVLLALVVLCVPANAPAAFCSPLNCAPSEFVLANGSLLAMRGNVYQPLRVIDLRTGATRWRLPAGVVQGRTLVARNGSLLTWYDIASGKRVADAPLQLHGTFSLVGASQDGTRAVLARTQHRSTTFAIVSPGRQHLIKLGGRNWSFDALSRAHFVLVRTSRLGYEVRLYDLATNTLVAQPLKDPGESAVISGVAFSRMSSPDGRYLFTMYIGSGGQAMVHELDLRNATARCIDLPGNGNFNAAITYGLAVSRDGRTLWAVSPGYARVAAIDVASHSVSDRYAFQRGSWATNAALTALSPDGKRIAVSDGERVWFVELGLRRVVAGPRHAAIALAFAPRNDRLWVVGERSRVSSLPVR